jgi:hypothetical protein
VVSGFGKMVLTHDKLTRGKRSVMADERWRDCEGTWDRLRWARLQKFETAKDAAESLGMKEDTYTAYERRPGSSKHTALTHGRAAQFATKFKVNWIWLLTGVGTPTDSVLTGAQLRVVTAMKDASPAQQERIATAVEALLKQA